MNRVVLVDFDGTVVEHSFPKIGKELPHAFEVLKELKEHGYKLILWTCREDEGYLIDRQFLTKAVEFCEENGIVFEAINESIPEEEFRPKNCKNRKPYAHYHIDDRNIGGFCGWEMVREILINKKKVKFVYEENSDSHKSAQNQDK